MRHSFQWFGVGMTAAALIACYISGPYAAAQAPAAATGSGTTGKVVETMISGGYTYVRVDDGSKKIWAAAPQFTVAVGDKVVVPDGMAMRDFYSKTLDRTFDVVYFVSEIQVGGGKAAPASAAQAHGLAAHGAVAPDGSAPMAGHKMPGHAGTNQAAAAVDFSNIKKAEGGQTVAELFADRTALTGKPVAVRGRVVKFTPEVMGKNWLHVQDGTGKPGANDLTVSTTASAAVGNTVLVHGTLSTDKDFGFGYRYDAIIEDASVAVE